VRITFILWRGDIGGAERVTVNIAAELRRQGADARILFICDAARLVGQLEACSVPFAALDLERGSQVLAHPLRLRQALARERSDLTIAVSVGYLGAALRAAVPRTRLAGIEHGVLSSIPAEPLLRRAKMRIDRLIGVRAYDAEVAISRYMVELVERVPHARRVVLIPHGVEPAATVAPPQPPHEHEPLVVGFASRLFPGKGLDRLIGAVALLARAQPDRRVVVRVAGDGEMRAPWEALARELGVADRIVFEGWSDAIAEHWAGCHLAIAPNDGLAESFGMSVLEAMAAARPTIVSDSGALPELVRAGATGQVVAAGDERALADAIGRYLRHPAELRAHGAAAHARASAEYSLARCAGRYLALAGELTGAPAPVAGLAGRPRAEVGA